jgi:outer membrane protein TolC
MRRCVRPRPFLPRSASASSRSGGQNLQPNGNLVDISSPWNFSRGLSSNLELFDGFRRQNNLRGARAEQTTAESNERLQRFSVARNVKQQYFNVQAARESRAVRPAREPSSSRPPVRASPPVRPPSPTPCAPSSLSATAASPCSPRRTTSASPTPTSRARRHSVTAVGSDSARCRRWRSTAMPSGGSRRPSIQAARARSASIATLRSSAPRTGPPVRRISLSGNRSDQDFAPTGGRYSSLKSLRINFNYPLFNGMQREENVARANVAEDNARAQLRDARLG